jgi:plastocyanin
VKAGTTITFKSTSKDTGFVLDFGTSSPFDSGAAITGGADRPVSVVAKKPGCYTYSVGACTAGTRYGMCGDDAAQFVVSAK